MPLYEYYCENCKTKFEEVVSASQAEAPECPKCHQKSCKKLISGFAVGGQGDLRESTMHGCHDVTPKSGCGSGGCGHKH